MTEKEIPLIRAKKILEKDLVLDPNGFFVIEVDRKQNNIRVEYYSNVYKGDRIVSGKIVKIFIGKKADALSDTIAKHVSNLRPEHYMYIGRELLKAQYALEENKKYVQGNC